jgi:hypothetical protein
LKRPFVSSAAGKKRFGVHALEHFNLICGRKKRENMEVLICHYGHSFN